MKRLILASLIFVGAAAVAAIAAILLAPLWRWIERTTGIESIGHSGPAGWCFAATFGVTLLFCGVSAALLRRRTRRSVPAPSAR